MSVLHIDTTQYKSPLRTIVRSLLLGRQGKNDRLEKARDRITLLESQNQQLINQNRALRQQLENARSEIKGDHDRVQTLPQDVHPKRHNFGAKFIAMCCELSKSVGFRSTERVLKSVREWLGVDFDIPDWTTVRSWLCRIGVAVLAEESKQDDDWIWLADHSVQLGDMKVFAILGIRQRDLPQGRALQRTDMSMLATIPSVHRNKHEVAKQFLELSKKVGVPISIVIDGATELHEGAKCFADSKCFTDSKKDIVILDDIKHKAANILKRLIGKSERFQEFESHLGKTTLRIQQTELAVFLPPKKKEKGRFMNLSKLLKWGEMTLDQLQHPTSEVCADMDLKRLEAKLGWLREFESDLKVWQACQDIVSRTLERTNVASMYDGATADLQLHLEATAATDIPMALAVRESLVAVVWQCEQRVTESSHSKLKLVTSTEVLESLFGGYKRLQRDQTRGTFTTLLAALPALTVKMVPANVKRYLEATSNDSLRKWLEDSNLTNSTQSQRCKAYQATKERKKQEPRQNNVIPLAQS